MSEYTTKDVLVNWKCQRGVYKDDEMNWTKYHKMNLTVDELEALIIEGVSVSNMLSEYAKVSIDLGHPVGMKTYGEIIRLYELCEGYTFFDVSEIEEVFNMEYNNELEEKKFKEICMDIIARCPVSVKNKETLYSVQRELFILGDENEVWFAYRRGLFPKEMLDKLVYAMKEEERINARIAWIIAWKSV